MATSDATAVSTIRIGTRRSALALKQADMIAAALRQAHPDVTFEIQARDTLGDRDKTTPLPQMGKGLWTSEFEAKLVAGELDLVVHCVKDMPTKLPPGCVLAAVTEREDPRDTVIFREDSACRRLADLPAASIIGTSSVRRMAQLRRRYPALRFKDIRGNIDTRLKKLDDPAGGYDCIILAAAGLKRLGLDGRIAHYLDSSADGGGVLYAVGQGALGIEMRESDERVYRLVQTISHKATMTACLAERAVMRTLEGGCSVPIGVETAWEDGGRTLRLKATVVSLDGTQAVDVDRAEEVPGLEQAEKFGEKVAAELAALGAQPILDAINESRVVTAATS